MGKGGFYTSPVPLTWVGEGARSVTARMTTEGNTLKIGKIFATPLPLPKTAVLCCRFALASNGDESIPPDQCGFSSGTSILLYQTTLVTRFFPALFTDEQENKVVIHNTETKASAVRKVKISDKNEIFWKNETLCSKLVHPFKKLN